MTDLTFSENDLQELYHHGILGQKWGVRRFQNPDGTLTEAGRKRLNKQDTKWASKQHDKLYKQTYKMSKGELNQYVKNDLNKRLAPRNKDGSLSKAYVNDYNRKLAELMNKNIGEVTAPSGRTVQWIAKRGSVGVFMALADTGYDMSQVKNGLYSSGRVAYKKKVIDRVGI